MNKSPSSVNKKPSRRAPREQGLLEFEAAEHRSALFRPGLSPAERLAGWAEEGEVDAKRREQAKAFFANHHTIGQAITAARTRVVEGWAGAAPAELVGLYAVLHHEIYGAAPADLDKSWRFAVAAARTLINRDFDGDPEAAVDFIRWVWRRERAREKKRISNGNRDGFRISWRWQFTGREMLTEYRIDCARGDKALRVAR